MNRQWIVAIAVLIALGLLAGWIARNTYWDEIEIPLPLRGEAATNPFYSAQHLAEKLGAHGERRHLLGELPRGGIIVLADWHWSLLAERRRQLEQWVAAGGRLVLNPLSGGQDEFERWSGIARDLPAPSEHDEEEEKSDLDTRLANAGLIEDCTTLSAEPVASDERVDYEVCGLVPESWLTTHQTPAWSLSDGEALQAARVTLGRGSVTLLNVNVFGNRALLKHDHALLFVAATQLRAGDPVLFLSEDQHASLLELIWRYGAPVVVLAGLLLAMALWRNSLRFGPLLAPSDSARRSIAEQLRGTGRFVLRIGGGRALHAAMVRALYEAAERRIPGYAALNADERVDAIARASFTDVEQLSTLIHYAGAHRATELSHAITVLEKARRRLLLSKNTNEVTHER